MKQRDFTSAEAKEAILLDKEKFCGDCCWFYGEDTYGCGVCPYRFAELKKCGQKCEVPLKYVSKKEMRHHMAVLLQYHRWLKDWITVKRICPDKIELEEAAEFAYEYMKVFNKL